MSDGLLVLVVVVALLFDFTNGFHDSANSIATMVGHQGSAAQTGGCARAPAPSSTPGRYRPAARPL